MAVVFALSIEQIVAAEKPSGQASGTQRMAELTALLTDRPNDLTARWLLNIAYLTLGEYPDKVPEGWRIDPKAFESDYPLPRFRDIAGPAGVDVEDLAGGSITEDGKKALDGLTCQA